VVVCLLLLSASNLLNAQVARTTYVSGAFGNDGNPCTRAQPCATFQTAAAVTQECGMISCVDPGDFGPIVIQGCLTIDCAAGGEISGTFDTQAIVINSIGL